MKAITEGVRPEKPEEVKRFGFSDELWRTIEQCWLEDRNARPIVEDIISSLNDAVALWHVRETWHMGEFLYMRELWYTRES